MLAMTMRATGEKAKGRQAITGSLHWNFPDQKRLGELCLVQADDRNYFKSIERNGATAALSNSCAVCSEVSGARDQRALG